MKKGLNIVYLDLTRKNEVENFLQKWNDDTAFMECNTSGSTGIPNTIWHSKANMQVSARKTIEYFNLQNGSKAYLCLSTSTIAGMMMIVRALEINMTLIVGPISANALSSIDEPVEFGAIVPLQLAYTLKKDPSKLELVEKLIIGGAPVSEEMLVQLSSFGSSIFQTYGMTETISHVAIRKIGKDQEEYYTALIGIDFSTAFDGSLIIHYPEIGIPELQTNDIVDLADKDHFRWVGRKDLTINSGGLKLQPEHIEEILSKHISVPFFISSLTHEDLGEQVILVIEGEHCAELDKERVFSELSRYERPKQVLYVKRFVYSSSGKILRKETVKQISA